MDEGLYPWISSGLVDAGEIPWKSDTPMESGPQSMEASINELLHQIWYLLRSSSPIYFLQGYLLTMGPDQRVLVKRL